MSLTNSNSYIEPVAGASLNSARLQYNNSLRSLLANFKSSSAPTGVNIVTEGVALGEIDGMLYRSATTNALYISDSVHVKSSPVGGNFTRVGIGNRVENGIVALGANSTSYEIGELVATVSENGTLAANSRLYLCVSNTATGGSTSNFIDVGYPLGLTVGLNDNVSFTGQSATAIRYIATSNIALGTSSPSRHVDIVGDVEINGDIYLGMWTFHQDDINTYFGFPAADNFAIATNGTSRLRVVANGNIGIGTTSPSKTLSVTGDIEASGGLYLADWVYHSDDTNSYYGFPASDVFTINTNGSERLRVQTDGNVGIGTTTAVSKLQVVGTITATDINSSSDIRLKKDIETISDGLDLVDSINPVSFKWKSSDTDSYGFIAQELEKVLPSAVSTDSEGYKYVAYQQVIPILVSAIKELKEEIRLLKGKQ